MLRRTLDITRIGIYPDYIRALAWGGITSMLMTRRVLLCDALELWNSPENWVELSFFLRQLALLYTSNW